jgi:methyl-accepting chemotaxis protein
MTSMDSMTQQNAALVEEASAAAQALTEQAVNLTQMIGHYQVGSDGGAEPVARAAAPKARTTAVPERRTAARPWTGKAKTAPAPAAKPKKAAAGGTEEQWEDF